jgi:hypothetical protein
VVINIIEIVSIMLQRPETDESSEPRESSEDHAAEQEDTLDLADDGADGEFIL